MKWYRNLRIMLSTEDKLPFLEQPILTLPVSPEGQANPSDVVTTHQAWVKAQKEIAGLMLITMDPDIQKNLEHLGAYDMLKELKTLYVQRADQELLQTVREFYAYKQKEGQSVSSYILKIKSYIDNLERLSHAMTQNLSVTLILVSLRKEYDGFVQNYNMHSMGKTMTELHAMLKLNEQTLPPKEVAPALHAIRAGRIQKNQKKKSHKAAKGKQEKGKAKMGYAPVQAPPFAPKPKNHPTPKKDNLAKDAICHQCGIFTTELYSFPSTYWVYDTGCVVEAIGEFHLCLPSGLVLILHNCHYAPSITRGIISVSLLYKDDFVNRFENDNSISVSINNLIYFNAIPQDDIYEIVMSSTSTNDSSMFVVSNKRVKLNLDSALLWHCHLGHISKKSTEKLQHDGLLDSTDLKSFEKYLCEDGKKTLFTSSGKGQRSTWTNPHRLFETFKVFQKKVENQLGKTIKSLRSDRRGEYMSQEFLDHLRDHGIISHRTPPYTPQHNGVSERRNRTLLDMVRSMTSQTTLPKSFWDYALESAASILNMVPTKKVDKIPYEVWHGQALKLSYLKVWGCEALVKRDTLTKPEKLEPRSIKCIFIGYPKETIGYSFYYPPENKVFVARNAEFLENGLINQEAKDDQEIDEPQSDINLICRSTRTRRPIDRLCIYVDAEEHELGDLDNEVWALVDLPPDGKTVGHKWLFKKKIDMDGAVHTYKARLVAKGFTQTPGIDYKETFSSVADIKASRILIATAAFYDYKIWQMDVKTAFLNGFLNEDVYIEQP
ncbi:retrotransposon protein, putative, ty1-copia subclass [Tanacetum coccineum]|uniref:Retrotransposon protein, putative, ty1-copia subclass n=1 Tax=Tanacetum coccineum TaxID=301880 RepID=A0ABQ5G5E2_9ASTR